VKRASSCGISIAYDATPEDPRCLAAQEAFGAEHPWFRVERLAARSHFPMLEVPEEIARSIDRFLGEGGNR
jgi:hypothetical protein